MNSTTLTQVLALINILAGTANKLVPGYVGTAIGVGDDLLLVAQQALAAHAANVGLPMDQVLAQLHDLPPLTQDPAASSSNIDKV